MGISPRLETIEVPSKIRGYNRWSSFLLSQIVLPHVATRQGAVPNHESFKVGQMKVVQNSEFQNMYTPHWKAQHHMSMCRQDTLLPDSTRWSPPARSSGSGHMGGIPTQRLRSHLWKRSSREYQWGQHCTSAAGGPRPASRPGHADGRPDAFHVVQAAAWKLDAVLRTLSLRIARISGASCYWPEDMTSCKPCWLACCLAYFEAGLFLTDGAWCMISHVAQFIDGQWESKRNGHIFKPVNMQWRPSPNIFLKNSTKSPICNKAGHLGMIPLIAGHLIEVVVRLEQNSSRYFLV